MKKLILISFLAFSILLVSPAYSRENQESWLKYKKYQKDQKLKKSRDHQLKRKVFKIQIKNGEVYTCSPLFYFFNPLMCGQYRRARREQLMDRLNKSSTTRLP